METTDSDDPTFLKTRVHAPMIWILAPIILGYVLGKFINDIPFWPGALFSIIFVISWYRNSHKKLAFRILGITGLTLLSWGYYNYKIIPPPPVSLPQREVNLTLEITRPFTSKDQYHRAGGFARIVHAPTHLGHLQGQPVYYFLSGESLQAEPTKTMKVRAHAILSPVPNNGGFNDYIRNQGITLQLNRGEFTDIASPPQPLFTFFHQANQHLESILKIGSTQEEHHESNILVAMLLGKKSNLHPDQKEAFKRTGSLHLFAISGLHVGVIAAAIAFILHLIRIPKSIAAIIGLSTLLLYVQITGAPPSAMRAFLMVTFYWSARVFFRKKSPFSALLGSAFFVLIINPLQLWDVGFQLSYTVVATILLYGLPLCERLRITLETWLCTPNYWLHRIGIRCYSTLAGLAIIALAANIGSTPLSLYYFNIFTPGAILLSILLMPLASITIITGFTSLLLGTLGVPFISKYLNIITWAQVNAMEFSILYALKAPSLFLERSINTGILVALTIVFVFTTLILSHYRNWIQSYKFYLIPPIILIPLLLIAS